jgi:hypothetical protein
MSIEQTRYRDRESLAQTRYTAQDDYKHNLSGYCQKNAAELRTAFYSEMRQKYGLESYQFAYAARNRHRHDTRDRVQGAFLLIINDLFHLPTNWKPGQQFFVESESLEWSSVHYPVTIQLDEDDRVMGLNCDCKDHERFDWCKHLIVGWLLIRAYKALQDQGQQAAPVVVSAEQLNRDIFGDF